MLTDAHAVGHADVREAGSFTACEGAGGQDPQPPAGTLGHFGHEVAGRPSAVVHHEA
jgi:hypothetical protein